MAVAADSHRDFLIPARYSARGNPQKCGDALRLFFCTYIISAQAEICNSDRKKYAANSDFNKT
jgi:hypothetical protein